MLILSEQGRKQRIDTLAFSPDGDMLLAAGNGSWLDVWRLGESAPPSRHFETANSFAWIVDAQFIGGGSAVIATCGVDGLRIDPATPESVFRAATHPYRGSLWGLAVSPDEKRVIASTGCIFYPPPQGKKGLVSWLVGAGKRFRRDWFISFDNNPGNPTFLEDGRRFMVHEYSEDSSAAKCSLVVRSADTGERLETYLCPYAGGGSPVLSPAGEWLVVLSSMGMSVWSRDDLSRTPLKVSNDNRKHFTGIAFHPSGQYLAATSNDETVKLYDTATWRVATTFTWNVGRLRSVAFSPDGTRAAVGSDTGQIVVWDVDI